MARNIVRRLRALLVVTILALGSASALSTENPAAPSAEVLQLPDYLVTTPVILPPPEAWRYAKHAPFEILSSAGETETAALVRELQIFHRALEVVWPAIRELRTRPVALVLCADDRQFAAFKPAHANRAGAFQGMGSIFLHGPDRDAIVLNASPSPLNIHVPTTTSLAFPGLGGIPTSGVALEAKKMLYHDYTLFLLSAVTPRLPAWFEEGLAQIFTGMTITQNGIELGRLEDPSRLTIDEYNAIVAVYPQFAVTHRVSEMQMRDVLQETTTPIRGEERDFRFYLQRAKLMSLPELFAVESNSSTARNPIGALWAKQAYAFVHLGLYGENQRYQKSLLRFVTRLAHEPVSEALFKECFGVGYRGMESSLRLYLTDSAFTSLAWLRRKGEAGLLDPEPAKLRSATQAEIGRIKAATAELAGNTDLARRELLLAYRRGERDPNLLAALGLVQIQQGNPADAAKLLEAAVAQRAASSEPYVALARLRLSLSATSPETSLSAVQVEQIAVPLRLAIQHTPPDPAVPELLAEVWQRSAEKISRADAELLLRSAVTFPGHLKLTFLAAAACHDAGFPVEARALADRGIKDSRQEADRTRFQALKASFK